jgi:hypothetical protein
MMVFSTLDPKESGGPKKGDLSNNKSKMKITVQIMHTNGKK